MKCQSLYVPAPIKEIEDLDNILAERNRSNHKAYNDFINEKTNTLSTDTSSNKYKSEIYALKRFITDLKKFVKNGRWEDADIESAKTNYYNDIFEFLTSKSPTKLKDIYP